MKIAIQGHPTRGKEVIQILESLGGINSYNYSGDNLACYYEIHDIILCACTKSDNYKYYTLEEFEEEFPFKIGDKVIFPVINGWASGKVTGIKDFEYEVDTKGIYRYVEPHKLNLYQMKEERNITLTLEKAKEWYKKGGELKEIALQAFTEEELNPLPRSWEEFCDKYSKTNDKEYFIDADSNIVQVHAVVPNHCRSMNGDRNICPSKKSAEAHLAMIQLEQLRDCWRQGNIPQELKYKIRKIRNIYTVVYGAENAFLSFCDKQTAEEFLECFEDLIEKAGDLI